MILVLVLSRNRRKIRRNGLENKRVENQLNILWRRLHRLTLHLPLLLGRLLLLLPRCRILLLSLCCLHPLLHPLHLLFRHLQVINAMVIPQKQRLDKLWLLHQLLQPRQLWWLHMLQPRLCVSPRPQHIKFLNQRRNLPRSKSKMRTDVTRYTYKSFFPSNYCSSYYVILFISFNHGFFFLYFYFYIFLTYLCLCRACIHKF